MPMRFSLLVIAVCSCLLSLSQTTNIYTTSTTWTVPAGVTSISIKVYGGGGGVGGMDCGAGCTNAAASNPGYIVASFAVTAGNVVGIYPGGIGTAGTNSATNTGGGAGGVATYNTSYNGGKGGNAGPTGSSGGGGGGGAASVVTISSVIRIVAAGAGGGGGMANLANSGSAGTNTNTPNGASNTGGAGTNAAGDGGGGGGGGGGTFGGLGGSTHAAGSEVAGDGGRIGGNALITPSTTTSNTNIAWTSGGRIEITFLAVTPVTWIDFTAASQDKNVVLNWSTAQELQSKSYKIQRSSNGVDWSSIGEVAAAGNSTIRQDYQFIDKTIVVSNLYYYRLAQVDLDGKINYSKTIVYSAKAGAVRIYPNPATNHSIHVSLAEAANIVIYSSHGMQMLEKKLPAGDSQVDLTSLPAGVYFLKTGSEKISFVIK